MNFIITENLNDSRIIPFLRNDNHASTYHHPAWLKTISKTFKHKSFYLLLEDEKNILSFLPFVFVKTKIIGKRIVSLPFSTYCTPLLPADKMNEVMSFLINNFKTVSRINIRTLTDYTSELKEFTHTGEYVTHFLDLKSDIQKTFESFHPNSVRASIRRVEKNHLTIRYGDSESDLKIFYDLEVLLRKRLALPPLPFTFFRNIY